MRPPAGDLEGGGASAGDRKAAVSRSRIRFSKTDNSDTMCVVTRAQVIESPKAHGSVKSEFSFLAVYIGIVGEF